MSAQDRALEQRDRVDWYLREHGRPPTREELIELRDARQQSPLSENAGRNDR